jgi:tetratricopeptide (TPR) repeat protein
MRKTALRLFLFILGAYVLTYLGAFVYQLQIYPSEQLLPLYRIPWVFEEALRTLISVLPSVHLTAILLAFAISTHYPGGASLEDPSQALRKSIVLFMLFTLLFAAFDIGLHPMLQRHRHDRLYRSELGLDYLKRADQAQEQGNLETALRLYRDYLTIDPRNDLVDDRADKIAGQLSAEAGEEAREQQPAEPRPEPRSSYQDLSAAELVTMGTSKLEEDEDPFTAHYLARLALELDPGREDAQRLAGRAMQQIRELEPSRAEEREHDIYRRKVAGYTALDRGRPVEAYYIFEALKQEVPNDPDVREYYDISRRQASEVSYFIEEAEKTDTVPGVEQVLYLEPRDDPSRRAIYFDKLVRIRSGTWVHEPEIIQFTPGGSVEFHLTAPYGKISGDSLILRGIHRSTEENKLTPTYRAGSPPNQPSQIFPVVPNVEQLQRLSQRDEYFKRLSLLDLIKLEPVLSRFGYPPREVQVAVLKRLNEPFLFFILSFFAAALGLRLRARRRRFPAPLLIAVPLVPVILYFLLETYRYLSLLGFSLFITLLGMTATLFIFLAIQALLLFLGLLFTATYREP